MESGILDVTNDFCLLLVGKKESGIQGTCYQKEQQHSCERQIAFGFQMNPLQDGASPNRTICEPSGLSYREPQSSLKFQQLVYPSNAVYESDPTIPLQPV